MSTRGVFNFHTQSNPQFTDLSRVDSASDPDFLYYNGSIINNSTQTTQNTADPQIQYQDTRSLPILKDKSKYGVLVENFSLDGAGKVLPLLIPQIREFLGNSTTILNTNPNNTIYDVTFTWQTGPKSSPTVFQSTRSVQWVSQNQAAWTKQPPTPFVYPQLEIDYYYCYTYSWWLKLVNAALEMAWSDVKLAVQTFYPELTFGTKCPYYTYDEKSNLFSLYQDANTSLVPYGDTPGSPPATASPALPPNPQDPYGAASDSTYSAGEYSFVGWNTNWDNLLSNFNTVYYSDGIAYPSIGVLGTRISSPLGTESSAQAIEISGTQQDLVTAFAGNSLTFVPRTSSLGLTISSFVVGFPTILTQSVEIPASTPTVLNLNIGLVGSVSLIVGKTYTINTVGDTVWTTLGAADNDVGTTFVATGQAVPGKTGNAVGALDLANVSYLQPGLILLASGSPVLVTEISAQSITVVSPTLLPAQVWSLTFPPVTSTSTTTAGGTMLLDIGEIDRFPSLTSGNALNVTTGSSTSQVTFSSYVESFVLSDVTIGGSSNLYYTGTPYSFSPVTNYRNQQGLFAVGDIVQGNTSNTISEIIEIVGSGNQSGDTTLTISGQKNIFQIGDVIAGTNGSGKIVKIDGDNTGYAQLDIINQIYPFQIGDFVVSPFTQTQAQIVSISGDNTGYVNMSYFKAVDTATSTFPSIFVAGETLFYLDGDDEPVNFATVVQDHPEVTVPNAGGEGNQGYVTIKLIITSEAWGYIKEFPGTVVYGNDSGTQCDSGSLNLFSGCSLIVNNIYNSFVVGRRIFDYSVETSIFAENNTNYISQFKYISNAILSLGNVEGTFAPNDIITVSTTTNLPTIVTNTLIADDSIDGVLSVGQSFTLANGTDPSITGTIAEIQDITSSIGNFKLLGLLPSVWITPFMIGAGTITIETETCAPSFITSTYITDNNYYTQVSAQVQTFEPENGGLILKTISGSGFLPNEILTDLKSSATAQNVSLSYQTIICDDSGQVGTVLSDNGTFLTLSSMSGVPDANEQFVSSYSSKGVVTNWRLFEIGDTVTSAGWSGIVTESSFETLQVQLTSGRPAVGETFVQDVDPSNTAVIASIFAYFLEVVPGLAGSGWSVSIPSLTSSNNVTLNNPTTITTNLTSDQSIFSADDILSFNLINEIAQNVQLFLPENVAAFEVPQCKYQQLIPGPSFVNNPLPSPAWYLVMVQDFESTSSLWSPVASIVVATTFITVREEYSGTPITLGSGNLGSNATTSSFQKVLLEVPIRELPQTGYKGLISYKPSIETLSSLGSSRAELKNIDVLFQWRNRLTNSLTPLQLSNSGSATIRLLFKKIRE
jgi:hypothetical protein